MKIITFLLVSGLIFCATIQAEGLPGGHSLKKNENGEFYIVNNDGIVMIEPAIISLGQSRNWIVACIANRSIDSDPKRMMFINLKNNGTTDTINQENWEYFKSVYDGLGNVKMEKLLDDTCP